jgi:carboxymethylenebutenolidase
MVEQAADGYLAVPPDGDGNPVLVLHAWWGLNDTIKQICDRLAAEGFVAYAPDLYDGKIADNIDDAETYAGSIFQNLDEARQKVAEAVTYLSAQVSDPAEREMAVIGFSLGAFLALDLSELAPDLVRSVVVFYGTRPGDYTKSQAAYLGHYAEMDDFEPQEEVNALEQALRDAGRPVDFYHYSNTGHWFAEPDRWQAYNKEAAELAWERTLAFLRQ